MDKIRKYCEDADRVFETHKRILARQGYALYEISGCVNPNYELIKR